MQLTNLDKLLRPNLSHVLINLFAVLRCSTAIVDGSGKKKPKNNHLTSQDKNWKIFRKEA
jgi:hypothetical protein